MGARAQVDFAKQARNASKDVKNQKHRRNGNARNERRKGKGAGIGKKGMREKGKRRWRQNQSGEKERGKWERE